MLGSHAPGTAALVRKAGPLWSEATHSRFLEALSAGTLPPAAFQRWLAQDYLFAQELIVFQAILVAKAPRDCHKPLISGLVALDNELEWFGSHVRLNDLDLRPHPICRRYTDFLVRCAYTEPHPVLLAILFGVEAAYLTAWSAFEPAGPYAEFIERWSSASFAQYVGALRTLTERYPHEAAQERFNDVLRHEREFWTMSWEG
jgi:thiaminase/transcriptional activator TenA